MKEKNGVASVYIPAPKFLAKLSGTLEEKLIHCANKDLPTGILSTKIIPDSVDLSDRTFRDAWTYTADASVERTSADLDAADLTRYNMPENI